MTLQEYKTKRDAEIDAIIASHSDTMTAHQEAVMRQMIPRKVVEDIRAEIQKYADNDADISSVQAYYHCLQIIDKHMGKETGG